MAHLYDTGSALPDHFGRLSEAGLGPWLLAPFLLAGFCLAVLHSCGTLASTFGTLGEGCAAVQRFLKWLHRLGGGGRH